MEKIALPFSLDPLDPKLVLPKPKHSIDEVLLREIERSGRLIITRKRDGHRHPIAISGTAKKPTVRIYTRTMNEVTASFPHVVEEIRALAVPPGTLLDGELWSDKNGNDDIRTFGRLAGLAPADAIALQQEVGAARYSVFNVLAHAGRLMVDESFANRIDCIMSLVVHREVDAVDAIEVFDTSVDHAREMVKADDWEGLVLYDRDAKSAIRMDGNHKQTPRPYGAWKWKPRIEDDFFVRQWEYGTPGKRHEKTMGKLHLLQINPLTHEEVDCGEVGIGFSDKERDFFAREVEYPIVVQVEFLERTPSGKCREPGFMRIRTDKGWEECLLPEDLRGIHTTKKK